MAVILQNQVADFLLDLIAKGQHDDLLPSQNELRKRFNVSTVTVRKAVERLEREGLIYRKQGKGCFIRKLDEKAHSMRIFLIVPYLANLQGEFVVGLVEAARKNSSHIIFYCYDECPEVLLYELRKIEPKLVIWLAPKLSIHRKVINEVAALPLHLILFNRTIDHPGISSVVGDFAADGEKLGNIIIERGGRKILYLTYSLDTLFAQQRFSGLEAAARKHGASVDIMQCGSLVRLGKWEELAADLKTREFDTVVCSQGDLWNVIFKLLTMLELDTENFWYGSFNHVEVPPELAERTVICNQPVARMAQATIDLARRLQTGGKSEKVVFLSEFE